MSSTAMVSMATHTVMTPDPLSPSLATTLLSSRLYNNCLRGTSVRPQAPHETEVLRFPNETFCFSSLYTDEQPHYAPSTVIQLPRGHPHILHHLQQIARTAYHKSVPFPKSLPFSSPHDSAWPEILYQSSKWSPTLAVTPPQSSSFPWTPDQSRYVLA